MSESNTFVSSGKGILVDNNVKKYRYAMLEGRQHIVVPAASMAEGVWEGTAGKILYLENEHQESVASWDHRPVVIYHPELDGKPVKAANPEVLNNQKVGLTLNTVFDSKLRHEIWLDVERLDAICPQVHQNILNGKLTEVSTGMGMQLEQVSGVWNNETYDGIARKIVPDHLAILPDRKGAYSVAAGAGLLQTNQQKVSNGSDLEELVTFNEKEGYSVMAMTREQLVAVLVANGFSQEEDSEILTKWSVKKLATIAAPYINNNAAGDATVAVAPAKGSDTVANNSTVTVTPPTPAPAPAPAALNLTSDQWMAACPAELRPVFNEALTSREKIRTELITKIVANAKNVLPAEKLKTLPLDVLQGMAAVAVETPLPVNNTSPFDGYNFAGAAIADPIIANAASGFDEEPLPAPGDFFAAAK